MEVEYFDRLRTTWAHLAERSELAIQTSDGDRYRLDRFAQLLAECLESIQASIPTYISEPDGEQLLEAFGELRRRVEAARDGAMDQTVVGQLQPVQMLETGGRPRVEIDRSFLDQALNVFRLGPSAIASLLSQLTSSSISPQTVRRRIKEHGLREAFEPSIHYHHLPDEILDNLIRTLRTEQEQVGIRYIQGQLNRLGIYPPRDSIRLSLNRVYPARHLLDAQRSAIRRRQVYRVAGPNSVWHMDGQHEIVNFGIVVHGIIDGYSRLIVGLRASSNNTAKTVLSLFSSATNQYGIPSRVRGDRGGENQRVARWMEENRGIGRGSFLWGT